MSIGLLAIWGAAAEAYTYKGYGGCYNCNSYEGLWTLAGGQKPGSTAFIVGDFSIQQGALVCVNPGINKKDVRQGVGGTSLIEVVSSENQLVFDKRGFFTLEQGVLSTYPEFQTFCASYPAQCPNGAQALFEDTYAVSSADCKSGGLNWTPYEYLWGNHYATGTVYRDCDPNYPPSAATCKSVDDNVTYYCTTNVPFRDYSKGSVLFSCTKQ